METKKTTKKYIEAIGRRKTSTARVRLMEASKTTYVINDKTLKEYFPTLELQKSVTNTFKVAGALDKYEVSVHVNGGGIHSQAEAIQLGIARALVKDNEETKADLKKEGMLKRDGRAKERRKFGLKKARKAPQWSKR